MINSIDYSNSYQKNNLEITEKIVDKATLLFIKSHFKLYATNCSSISVKEIMEEARIFLLCDNHYSKICIDANFEFTRIFPHESIYLESTCGSQIGDVDNEYLTWDITDKEAYSFRKNAKFIQKSLNLAQKISLLLFNNFFDECALNSESLEEGYKFLKGTYIKFEKVCKAYEVNPPSFNEVSRILIETSIDSYERVPLLRTILEKMKLLFTSYFQDYSTTILTTMMMRNQLLAENAVNGCKHQNKVAIVAGTAHFIPLDIRHEEAISFIFSKLNQQKIKYVVLKASNKIKDKDDLEFWNIEFDIEKKQLKDKRIREGDHDALLLTGPLIEIAEEIFEMNLTPKFWSEPENDIQTPNFARLMSRFLERALAEIPAY